MAELQLVRSQAAMRQTMKIVFSISILLAVSTLLLYQQSPYIIFTSFGFAALATICLPYILSARINLLSTWTFFSLSVFLGCFLRGIYIGLNYPNDNVLNFYYYIGNAPSYFYLPAFILLTCLFVTAITFTVSKGSRASSLNSSNQINETRLIYFGFFSLFVSLIAIIAYIQLTGGLDTLNLSKKRSTIESIVLEKNHRTWQSLKTIASISLLAHLILLQDGLSRTKNRKLKLILSALLFLTAIFLPFYSSTRSDVIIYMMFSLLVFYSANQAIPWKKVLIYLFFALTLFQTMSILRSANDDTNFRESFVLTNIFDRLVLNRNGLELGKTAHVIDAVPNTLETQYGKTIGVYLVAPIPRELWNAKPLISSGPIIGNVIYGNKITGVPPGFYGEMFWNFSYFGLIIGSVLLGWLLKWVDTRFKPNKNSVAIFIFGPIQIGHFIVGVSLGYGLMNASIRTVIALIVFRFISQKLRRS